VVTLNRN